MVFLLISLELAPAQMLILHHLAVTPFLLPVLVLALVLALALVQLAQAAVGSVAAIHVLAPVGSILVLLKALALLSAAPPL